MTLTTSLHAGIVGNYSKAVDLSSPQATVALGLAASLGSGTLNTQADRIWADTRTLAASTSEDLDLVGVQLDAFGDLFAPLEIVAIMVFAADTNINNVVIGGAASNQFVGPFGAATHTHSIKPGGVWFWYAPAGWTITAGTGDLLKVLNGGAGTSVDYSIIVLGRSA